jgi:hypothetical protein
MQIATMLHAAPTHLDAVASCCCCQLGVLGVQRPRPQLLQLTRRLRGHVLVTR